MNIAINYKKRIEKLLQNMEKSGIDVFIGTRTVSVSYVSGAFVPWRSAVIVGKNG